MSLPPLEQRIARYRELSGDALRELLRDRRLPREDQDAIHAEFERRRAERTARLNRPGTAASDGVGVRIAAESRGGGGARESKRPTAAQQVTVTDIDMPFGSMVSFMVRWSLASIPAFIILFAIFFLFFFVLRMLIDF